MASEKWSSPTAMIRWALTSSPTGFAGSSIVRITSICPLPKMLPDHALVHLGENNPSASDLEWAALVGPLERLGHRSVEVLDELEDAPVQILHGGEVAPLEEPARQNREP